MIREVHLITQITYFDIKIHYAGYDGFVVEDSLNPPIKNYAIHFVEDGEGVFTIRNKEYKVKKGDILFVPPKVNYATHTKKDNRLKIYYICFSSPNSSFLMEKAGLTINSPVTSCDYDYVLPKIKLIFSYLSNNSFTSIMKANAEFFNILCSLFEKIETNNITEHKTIDSNVLLVEEFIKMNYNEDITMKEICSYVNMSRTYLSTIFKKVKGITIKDFLNSYRINRACDLLVSTDMSIIEIAISCGFNNSTSFYREFVKFQKASPRYFRKKNHLES